MSIFNKRTGTSLLATASCLAALTLFNGCGGGGGGGDLNLGINGSTFASAITLPNANNTSDGVCAGRIGNLQVTQVTISVTPTNQIAVGLAAPNIQGFTFSQGGYDPSTRRVNFRGEAIETNGGRIPVLFDGILNNSRQPNTISGTLDFTCWRGFVNLVAQTGGDDGRPENDDFSAATPISGPSGSISGTTQGNTGEPGEPNHACLSRNSTTGMVNSVWYRWTAPSTGQFRFFSTDIGLVPGNTGTPTTTSSDPTIAFYTGNAVNSLAYGPANDDNNNSGQANPLNFCTTINATAGTVYNIAIASFFGRVGTFTLNWQPGTCTNPRDQASCPGANGTAPQTDFTKMRKSTP
ncbi:MAG: hypothetical protein KY445_02155 [Armatimonadetes bacterium]|nr:hypothetical protein [Armatimonadota bacterium]